MKIKKPVVFLGGLIVISIITISALTHKNDPPPDNLPDATISLTEGTIQYSPTVDGSKFNIDLYKGSYLAIGRESWKKGDKIVFQVSGTDCFDAEVGIIPAEDMEAGYDYDDYGMIIGQAVSVSSDIQEFTLTVPESGEYGIATYYVINDLENLAADGSSGSVHFTLEVNKKFINPLVK